MMMRTFQHSWILSVLLAVTIFCHTAGASTSFAQRWSSLTFLLECNNPLHQQQRQGHRPNVLTQLKSTTSTESYDTSNQVTIVAKKRSHPISSVFEPTTATHNDTSTFEYDNEDDYQRRKQEWMTRYTTLNGLRDTFGGNRNKVWGDLDPSTTRRLYKSLLPTALCELVLDLGVRPEELAPLAYAARKAAKLYARERSRVPARVAATAYDGFRQLKRYGKFQPTGMSYDQVWDKYRQLTYLETTGNHHQQQQQYDNSGGWSEQDLVAKTCMKIIESSCRTNPRIDQLALQGRGGGQNQNNDDTKLGRADMKKIAQTLEDDVRRLLAPYATS